MLYFFCLQFFLTLCSDSPLGIKGWGLMLEASANGDYKNASSDCSLSSLLDYISFPGKCSQSCPRAELWFVVLFSSMVPHCSFCTKCRDPSGLMRSCWVTALVLLSGQRIQSTKDIPWNKKKKLLYFFFFFAKTCMETSKKYWGLEVPNWAKPAQHSTDSEMSWASVCCKITKWK